jgi:hypothetical protein
MGADVGWPDLDLDIPTSIAAFQLQPFAKTEDLTDLRRPWSLRWRDAAERPAPDPLRCDLDNGRTRGSPAAERSYIRHSNLTAEAAAVATGFLLDDVDRRLGI